MTTEHIKELVAMLMIGDGVIALAQPRRHALLWRFGPASYRDAMEAFVRRPGLTRLLGGVQAGLGLWLASRQQPR